MRVTDWNQRELRGFGFRYEMSENTELNLAGTRAIRLFDGIPINN
jgi:hypothetical protein